MGMSDYIAGLRSHVGHDLLLLPSACAVVTDDEGRVLLVRRADDGTWSLPAGALDPGEQPASAAVRETFEETGVRVTVSRLAGVVLRAVTYPNGDKCHYLTTWFRCHAVGGEARVNDDESLEVAWFEVTGMPDLDPVDRLRIETALSEGPAWFASPDQSYEGFLP